MAYNLTYWHVDSKDSAYQIKSVRLKSINEVMPLSLPHNRPADTNVILLERTGNNQGKYDRIIYQDKLGENCSAF